MKTERGFTLVELLVVITIIAILSVIGLTIYTKAQQATRDGKRRADIDAIAKALEQYKAAKGTYPIHATSRSDTNKCGQWSSWENWTVGDCGLTDYIQAMPTDPINNDLSNCISDSSKFCHIYRYCSDDGTYFILGVNLENPPTMGNPTNPPSFNCQISSDSAGHYIYYKKSQL